MCGRRSPTCWVSAPCRCSHRSGSATGASRQCARHGFHGEGERGAHAVGVVRVDSDTRGGHHAARSAQSAGVPSAAHAVRGGHRVGEVRVGRPLGAWDGILTAGRGLGGDVRRVRREFGAGRRRGRGEGACGGHGSGRAGGAAHGKTPGMRRGRGCGPRLVVRGVRRLLAFQSGRGRRARKAAKERTIMAEKGSCSGIFLLLYYKNKSSITYGWEP